MSDRPTFELGLVMAGAVSAGAYTAGVLDFLIEALDAIEDVRAGRDTGYLRAGLPNENPVIDPPHQLRLTAMSGTSAGAMVTAIFTTLLGTRIPPVGPDRRLTDSSRTDNPLYDAWVQQIHWDKLLATDDLGEGNTVRSLLNARHLEEIVGEALRYAERDDYQRPYVGSQLPIFLCTGNLRGVRYSISLGVEKGVVNEHQMSMHADWMGFCFDRDPAARLPGMRSLAPGRASDHWDTLGAAALASGAFPIGFSARELRRDFTDYEERRWYDPSMPQNPVRRTTPDGQYAGSPEEPSSWLSQSGGRTKLPPVDRANDFSGGEYRFVNVDGGVFNNEPLELCRVAVAGDRARNPRDPLQADRAVLLIDPFPNLFELDRNYNPLAQAQIFPVIRSLIGALVSQSRFKPEELALAKDPNVASRHAVMPIRYGAGDRPEQYAIACGSLGGFGGFLSKAFRHHDFMLGRRNCQRFLSHHFVLPASNPLFAEWSSSADRGRFQVRPDRASDVVDQPIVPLLGKLASDAYTAIPAWPVDPADLSIDRLRDAILARANALKDSLVAQYEPDWVLRQGIKALWAWNSKKWAERFAIGPMLDDLKKRDLLTRG
jgi:hypothetical protein